MSCKECEAVKRCEDAFSPHAYGCNNYGTKDGMLFPEGDKGQEYIIPSRKNGKSRLCMNLILRQAGFTNKEIDELWEAVEEAYFRGYEDGKDAGYTEGLKEGRDDD
jgi:hypothetical protein